MEWNLHVYVWLLCVQALTDVTGERERNLHCNCNLLQILLVNANDVHRVLQADLDAR